MIALSPFLSIGTFALKAIVMLMANKQKQKHESELDRQSLMASVDTSRTIAANNTNTKEASVARRTVLILMTLSLVVLPVMAPLLGVGIAIGWTVIDPGFLWGADTSTLEFRTFGDPATATVVVAPVLYDLFAIVLGYYYGGKVTQ